MWKSSFPCLGSKNSGMSRLANGASGDGSGSRGVAPVGRKNFPAKDIDTSHTSLRSCDQGRGPTRRMVCSGCPPDPHKGPNEEKPRTTDHCIIVLLRAG